MIRYAFDARAQSAGAITQLIEIADPTARDASLVVHRDDDMFAFSIWNTASPPLGAMAYFRAGLSINRTITKIAEWRFGHLGNVASFLDFAAGYGRSTRFLVQHLPADRVCVADIQEDALAFQSSEFGVKTLLSTPQPEDLHVDQRFDMVFVGSLLTHLPDRTFGRWLAKLWEFVAPGGVLVFSVHDEAINEVGVELDDRGFAFIPSTEVASLSTDDYGTNFTTTEYVRKQLRTAVGADADTAIRLPRALCFMQDVWVVPKGGLRADNPLIYESGPCGSFDDMRMGRRHMSLRGWAADRGFATPGSTSHRIVSVDVHLNGVRRARVVPGGKRPDVAAHLGSPEDPAFRASGWRATVWSPTRRLSVDDVVVLVATCEHGARFVIDATRADDMIARVKSASPTTPLGRRLATGRRLFREGGFAAVFGYSVTKLSRAFGRYT